METNYPTIAGKDLIWHTEPFDRSKFYLLKDPIIVAFAYKKGCGNDEIADRVFFDCGSMYLGDKDKTYEVAWAEFDRSIADNVLNHILDQRKKYDIENAAEIKAKRIAELEAELAELKK